MNEVALAFSRAAAAARGPSRPAAVQPAAAPHTLDLRHAWLAGTLVWALLVLMIVPDGFDYATLNEAGGTPIAGGTLTRLLWLGLLGLGVAITAWRTTAAFALTRSVNVFLLVFVALALASMAWSIDPEVTARRLVRVMTILFASTALALVAWHPQRLQEVLRPLITAVLAGSLLFGMVWPTLAIHQENAGLLAGNWHGLANHKNGLGDLACIGLILWFHAWLARETRASFALAGLALAATCLVLSRSSTSVVATGFTLLFLFLLLRAPPALRRYMPWIVGVFVAALLTYTLVLLQILPGLHTLLAPVGAITGKDMTFTGRTEIWDLMFENIRLHPVLGAGYGAFWTGTQEGSPAFEFVIRLRFDPGSAHNGYLDVLNDLGAVGLAVLFGYLATFVIQSLRLMRTERVQAALFLGLFLQQAITNLAESRWFSPVSVDFVIMTLATVALARALREPQPAEVPA